ncbi:MAG TPA: hypothetical protein VGO66_08055 [Solirubrobacterales bacterium]|jgi:hypothetical protein|nr:hypothetical protein [Solirubrobacterales bacterium]
MGKGLRRTLAVAAVMLLTVVGNALAAREVIKVHLQAGNLIVIGEGGFAPNELPKNVDAPIEIFGKGHLETVDGTYPPILDTIEFEFDKHGSVDTTGLAKCSAAKLAATTVPQARKLCPGAIVGTGIGKAVVLFPEQGPIPATSPITLFNGPEIGGDPSFFAHAHLEVPAPTTFVVPVRIETIHNGRYGYRVTAKIPKIAGGYGHPLSGSIRVTRKWTYKGKRHSYVNARCPDGRLQATGKFGFKDGTQLKGTFLGLCKTLG